MDAEGDWCYEEIDYYLSFSVCNLTDSVDRRVLCAQLHSRTSLFLPTQLGLPARICTNSLTVTNGAKLILQGANLTGQVGGQWAGYGVTISAVDVTVQPGSSITADEQGYTGGATGQAGNGPGGGCGSTLYDSAGGSHGGLGSGLGTCSSGPTYGATLMPALSPRFRRRWYDHDRWRRRVWCAGRWQRGWRHTVDRHSKLYGMMHHICQWRQRPWQLAPWS